MRRNRTNWTLTAVSGGGYSPSQQDCPPANADANNAGQTGAPANPVPGCHTAQANVGSDNGTRFAEAGVDQLPQGYPDTGGILFGVGTPGDLELPAFRVRLVQHQR